MARFDSGFRYDSGARFDEPEENGPRKPMSQNLISTTMTAVQRDAILTDVNGALTKLDEYLTPLTPDQRRRLARLADTNIGLLKTALQFAQQNPGAIPADLDVAEFAKDVELAEQITQIKARIAMLEDAITDISIAVHSDAYIASLEIYRLAQALGRGAAFDAFIDDFGRRFARGPRRVATAPGVVTPQPVP
jgi:hypothetical protein